MPQRGADTDCIKSHDDGHITDKVEENGEERGDALARSIAECLENKDYVETMAMYLQAASTEGATEAPPYESTVGTTSPTPPNSGS